MCLSRAVFWSYFGQFGSVLILFTLSIVIARILTPFQVGIYAVGAAIAAILTAISTIGLISYVIRDNDDKPNFATAFTLNIIGSLLLAAGLMLAGIVGPQWGMAGSLGWVLCVLALRPIISILEFLPAAKLQRNMEFKILGLATLMSSLVNLVVTTILALDGYGAVSIAIGIIVGAAAQVGIYVFFVPRYFSLRFSLSGWQSIARFGLEVITISGLSTITKRTCELIIGAFIGTTALGIFTRATNIADTLFNGIYGAGTRVIFANLCREKRDKHTIARPFLNSFELLIAIFWPFVCGIAVLSKPIILLLYGEIWLPAAPVLAILMIGQVMALTFALNWELFVISEKTAVQVRYEMIRSILSLIAFAGGSYFGLVGAASGRFVDAVAGMLLYIPAYQLMVPVSKHILFGIYFRCAIATAAAVSPAFIIMSLFSWNAATSWIYLGPSIILGIIIWALAHYLMGSVLKRLLLDSINLRSKGRLKHD